MDYSSTHWSSVGTLGLAWNFTKFWLSGNQPPKNGSCARRKPVSSSLVTSLFAKNGGIYQQVTFCAKIHSRIQVYLITSMQNWNNVVETMSKTTHLGMVTLPPIYFYLWWCGGWFIIGSWSLFDISWIGDFFVHLPKDGTVPCTRLGCSQANLWFPGASLGIPLGELVPWVLRALQGWIGIEYHRIYKDRVRIWNSAKYS
jgi:hypothetical protein